MFFNIVTDKPGRQYRFKPLKAIIKFLLVCFPQHLRRVLSLPQAEYKLQALSRQPLRQVPDANHRTWLDLFWGLVKARYPGLTGTPINSEAWNQGKSYSRGIPKETGLLAYLPMPPVCFYKTHQKVTDQQMSFSRIVTGVNVQL